jgi:Uma2 family endonuclease
MAVHEYEKMAMAGVLDDPRVELIDGYLVKKTGKNPAHVWTVDAIVEALRTTVSGWWCRKEDPIRIPDFDEPEPDVALVRGTRDDYRDKIPGPGDLALVVEVSESTLDRDQGEKLTAYARGGIPRYWIVNLVSHQIEEYSDPVLGKYQSHKILKPGMEIEVVIEGNVIGRIAVDKILP